MLKKALYFSIIVLMISSFCGCFSYEQVKSKKNEEIETKVNSLIGIRGKSILVYCSKNEEVSVINNSSKKELQMQYINNSYIVPFDLEGIYLIRVDNSINLIRYQIKIIKKSTNLGNKISYGYFGELEKTDTEKSNKISIPSDKESTDLTLTSTAVSTGTTNPFKKMITTNNSIIFEIEKLSKLYNYRLEFRELLNNSLNSKPEKDFDYNLEFELENSSTIDSFTGKGVVNLNLVKNGKYWADIIQVTSSGKLTILSFILSKTDKLLTIDREQIKNIYSENMVESTPFIVNITENRELNSRLVKYVDLIIDFDITEFLDSGLKINYDKDTKKYSFKYPQNIPTNRFITMNATIRKKSEYSDKIVNIFELEKKEEYNIKMKINPINLKLQEISLFKNKQIMIDCNISLPLLKDSAEYKFSKSESFNTILFLNDSTNYSITKNCLSSSKKSFIIDTIFISNENNSISIEAETFIDNCIYKSKSTLYDSLSKSNVLISMEKVENICNYTIRIIGNFYKIKRNDLFQSSGLKTILAVKMDNSSYKMVRCFDTTALQRTNLDSKDFDYSNSFFLTEESLAPFIKNNNSIRELYLFTESYNTSFDEKDFRNWQLCKYVFDRTLNLIKEKTGDSIIEKYLFGNNSPNIHLEEEGKIFTDSRIFINNIDIYLLKDRTAVLNTTESLVLTAIVNNKTNLTLCSIKCTDNSNIFNLSGLLQFSNGIYLSPIEKIEGLYQNNLNYSFSLKNKEEQDIECKDITGISAQEKGIDISIVLKKRYTSNSFFSGKSSKIVIIEKHDKTNIITFVTNDTLQNYKIDIGEEILYSKSFEKIKPIGADYAFWVDMKKWNRWEFDATKMDIKYNEEADRFSGDDFFLSSKGSFVNQKFNEAPLENEKSTIPYDKTSTHMRITASPDYYTTINGIFGENYTEKKRYYNIKTTEKIKKYKESKDKTLKTIALYAGLCDIGYNLYKSGQVDFSKDETRLAIGAVIYGALDVEESQELTIDKFTEEYYTENCWEENFKGNDWVINGLDNMKDDSIENLDNNVKKKIISKMINPNDYNYSTVWNTNVYIPKKNDGSYYKTSEIMGTPKCTIPSPLNSLNRVDVKYFDNAENNPIQLKTLILLSKIDENGVETPVFKSKYESPTIAELKSTPDKLFNQTISLKRGDSFRKDPENDLLKDGWYSLKMKVEKIGTSPSAMKGWEYIHDINTIVFKADNSNIFQYAGSNYTTLFPYIGLSKDLFIIKR